MIPFPGPRWCLTPAAMAAVDRAAIDGGLAGAALMESAGRAVAEAVLDRRPGRVTVLAGGGNNGGDGFVAARHLAAAGIEVEILLFADPGALSGDAAAMWRALESAGLPTRRIVDADSARAAVGAAAAAIGAAGASGVVIDALLGTGLSGAVREPFRTAIEALGELAVPVVAVDVPSGLSGETGEVLEVAVRANLTVTFGFPKPGLFLREGPERAGRVIVAPLGYPPAALAAAGMAVLEWVGLDEVERALPPRRHDLHKGDAGRLLLLAGSARYPGAAVLAAGAALRSGAGLVVVATAAGAAGAVRDRHPEAIVVELPERRAGGLAARAAERVAEAAAESDAVALGPGLTTEAGVREAVGAALSADAPAVVDADALNVLAADPAAVRRSAATILTPHPGELGRWLDRPAARVDAGRVEAAREAAARWGATVVLKGSPTVVAEPGGRAALVLAGNPGLATGGSGDVLTGLVGSLLAQGVAPPLAARAAPLLHALAADRAAADLGERALAPSDLFAHLPLVVREIAAGRGRALLARLDHPRAALLAAGEGRRP